MSFTDDPTIRRLLDELATDPETRIDEMQIAGTLPQVPPAPAWSPNPREGEGPSPVFSDSMPTVAPQQNTAFMDILTKTPGGMVQTTADDIGDLTQSSIEGSDHTQWKTTGERVSEGYDQAMPAIKKALADARTGDPTNFQGENPDWKSPLAGISDAVSPQIREMIRERGLGAFMGVEEMLPGGMAMGAMGMLGKGARALGKGADFIGDTVDAAKTARRAADLGDTPKVQSVAIKMPNGEVVIGAAGDLHFNVRESAIERGLDEREVTAAEGGYTDSRGAWLSREDAVKIAQLSDYDDGGDAAVMGALGKVENLKADQNDLLDFATDNGLLDKSAADLGDTPLGPAATANQARRAGIEGRDYSQDRIQELEERLVNEAGAFLETDERIPIDFTQYDDDTLRQYAEGTPEPELTFELLKEKVGLERDLAGQPGSVFTGGSPLDIAREYGDEVEAFNPSLEPDEGVDTAASLAFAPEPDEPLYTWMRASKAVDDAGDPLTLYHGTSDDVAEFDLSHPNRKDAGWLGHGVYTTDDPELARSYASMKRGDADPNVMPLYARIENPYMATIEDKQRIQMIQHNQGDEAGRAASIAFTEDLKNQGYDGVILDYSKGGFGKSKEYVIFDSKGVKSAIGNDGNYSEGGTLVNSALPIGLGAAAGASADDDGDGMGAAMGMAGGAFLGKVGKGASRVAKRASGNVSPEIQAMMDAAELRQTPSEFYTKDWEKVEQSVARRKAEGYDAAAIKKREDRRKLGNDIEILDPYEHPYIQPEDLADKAVLGFTADQTTARQKVNRLAGSDLDPGVYTEGGTNYDAPPGDVWASRFTGADHVQRQVDAAAKKYPGKDVIAIFSAMTPQAADFSVHALEAVVQQVVSLKLPDKAIDAFDAEMRKLVNGVNANRAKSSTPYPAWPGILDPKAMDIMSGRVPEYWDLSRDLSKAMMKRMTLAKFRDMGFPLWKDTVDAISRPDLKNAELGDGGAVFLKMVPGAELTKGAPHATYDHGIKGSVMGRMENSTIPKEYTLPKTIESFAGKMTKPGPKSKANPRPWHESEKVGAVRAGYHSELVDDDYIDNMKMYLKIAKEAGASNPMAIIAPILLVAAQRGSTED